MSKEILTEEQDSEALIKGILAEADTKAKAIEHEAEQYAQRILSSAESQAKQILDRALKEAEQRTQEIMSAAEAKLSIERVKSKLEFEAKIIKDITKKAAERFNAIRKTDAYYGVLLAWTCECILGVGAEDVILETGDIEKEIITDSFLDAVKEKLSHYVNKIPKISISHDVLPVGGVRAKSIDSHILFDNTINARFLRKEPAMYEALYKELDAALQKLQSIITA